MVSDKAFPSRVLNKLRLQRSKRGIHLPAQVTVKPLHRPIALPWKHWYLTCPEEQERKYSKLQTELFRPIGPHQCSAETWERLTQMQAFLPSLVLPALWARKHHAMPECSNYRGSKLRQWPATRHSQAECSTNSSCRDPNVGCTCPRRLQ